MELPDAQKEFMEILHRAKDPSVVNGFLSWVKENWFAGDNNLNIGKYSSLHNSFWKILILKIIIFYFLGSDETAIVVNGVEADELLENIATDLRQLLPMEAQLPSETIIFPKTGQVRNNVNINYISLSLRCFFFFRMQTVILLQH